MMRTNGGKLRIDDLSESDVADARDIYCSTMDWLTMPSSQEIGESVIAKILKPDSKPFLSMRGLFDDVHQTNLRAGMATALQKEFSSIATVDSGLRSGLRSGLYSGLYSGLRSGLYSELSGLYSGLRSGLYSGLDIGLRSGLRSGLYSGLDTGLDSGLETWLDSGLDTGLNSGLDSGLETWLDATRKLEMKYCGIYWTRYLIQYLIGAHLMKPHQTDWGKLALMAAFVRYCPIVGTAGDDDLVVFNKPSAVRWKIEGTTPAPFNFPIYSLHANGCPAVELGSLKLYYWNNVEIPERMGRINCERWNPKWVLDETNSEVRRILIQEIGFERLVHLLGAKTLDQWREYELLHINIDDMPVVYRLLKMTCPSTGDTHILRVPPDCHSAEAAITWVNHDIHPDSFQEQA